jgi:hypothetical protein
MVIKSNIRPISYAAVKQKRAAGKAQTLCPVDQVIHEVNRVLSDAKLRDICRCDPAVGSFWTVSGNLELTKTDIARVRKSFMDAGWPKVHVVFWNGQWGVTLSESTQQTFGRAVFNGKVVPAYYAREPQKTASLPRRASSQQALRNFAFQR